MLIFVSLVFGTFISEDVACVTAGLLIQRGELSLSSGIAACTLGIFIGDVGLWGAGRIFGSAALAWPWIARRLDRARAQELRGWLERHAAVAIVGSRFLPGTRLPLYVIAGLLELPALIFGVWALVGALLWTPLVVLLTARLGDALVAHIFPAATGGRLSGLIMAAAVLLSIHLLRAAGSRRLGT
jgi:membrane protein DedA with SNARE-associated domain